MNVGSFDSNYDCYEADAFQVWPLNLELSLEFLVRAQQNSYFGKIPIFAGNPLSFFGISSSYERFENKFVVFAVSGISS